ncbi:MAG: 4Fe-4S binding protein [bacterium]
MTHAGLSVFWSLFVILAVIGITVRHLFLNPSIQQSHGTISFSHLPIIGKFFLYLASQTKILLGLKLVFLALFSLIIVAGLWGSPIAERNIATVLTWNLWWTGIIISVWFFGSSWCAVCPWDMIANWLARRRLWRREPHPTGLNLKVPLIFRSLWSALALLTLLTWLELGIGVTESPYATASLALMMVVLATLSLAIYEDKAFCRYFCPVGRTIGVYSQLSPVALRPIDPEICTSCSTLDCYHGNETISPCPTRLVMGRLKESTYCISCGNCTQSCPDNNINWQLRTPNVEAVQDARPHMDEACFMIGLLGLTSFHGLTMLPEWQEIVSQLARWIGDSGQLIITFTLLLMLQLAIIFAAFGLATYLFILVNRRFRFSQVFSGFAFVTLPIAFSYHVAHNIGHLLRESGSLQAVILNPLGTNTQPLSMLEKHERAMQLLIPADIVSLIQACLLVFGFWLAMQVVQHRGSKLFGVKTTNSLSIIAFIALMTMANLWLLTQPMLMRM